MSDPTLDHRSPRRVDLDEQIASEPHLPPAEPTDRRGLGPGRDLPRIASSADGGGRRGGKTALSAPWTLA